MSRVLRVIDAGYVSPLRSQALWHGLADAMAPGDAAVLSFCRPAEPYVCIGYHRRCDELDLDACERFGLPVLRRQIGGGPVYLDCDQLFFQLSLPAQSAPAGVHRLYEQLLGPVATALRWLGIDAEVASTNDIVAGGRKVSGTGAGQIGDGVVVVGNVMFAFPYERMAAVMNLPDEEMRGDYLRLMRAHLGPLAHLREEAVKLALRRAYASALDLEPSITELRPDEEEAIARWEGTLSDPDWIAGPALPPPPGRQVKVRAGVWLYSGGDHDLRVRTVVEDGRVTAARIDAPDLNGAATELARVLIGVAARREALAEQLVRFGEDGERVLSALEPGMVVK